MLPGIVNDNAIGFLVDLLKNNDTASWSTAASAFFSTVNSIKAYYEPNNTQVQTNTDPPMPTPCPEPSEPCMNEENCAACLESVSAGCREIVFLESCPLQFACGDSAANTTTTFQPTTASQPIDNRRQLQRLSTIRWKQDYLALLLVAGQSLMVPSSSQQ